MASGEITAQQFTAFLTTVFKKTWSAAVPTARSILSAWIGDISVRPALPAVGGLYGTEEPLRLGKDEWWDGIAVPVAA